MSERTLATIAKHYDESRERTIGRIRSGEMSAGLSGIENYPKPWAELDIEIDYDLSIISSALSWNGSEHMLRVSKESAATLNLLKELMKTYHQTCGEAREIEVTKIRARMFRQAILELMQDGRYHGVDHCDVMRGLVSEPRKA